MKETEVLTNEQVIVVKGEEITVRPYSWMDTFRMARPLEVVLRALAGSFDSLRGLSDNIDDGNQLDSIVSILSAINTANDDDKLVNAIQELVAKGIGKDKKYVAAFDLEEIFIAGKAVFEVNKDFFSKKMPMLMKKDEKEDATAEK